jgi:hypothetical protein
MRSSAPVTRRTAAAATNPSQSQNQQQQQQAATAPPFTANHYPPTNPYSSSHHYRHTSTNKNATAHTAKSKAAQNRNLIPVPLFSTTTIQSTQMTPYVLQGLYYFLSHKILWKTSLCPILWTLVFVVAACCILFPLAFIPQALFFSGVMTPWLGIPLALLVALVELLVVVMIFSAIILLPITDKLFDEVLVLRGHEQLVLESNNNSCCGCCSAVSIIKMILSIVTLPINLIPVVGTVLWVFINGRFYAWDAHSHYHYELKSRKFFGQKKFVRQRWFAYHMFGMQAMALELIPFANVLFVFTNTVGAALWAADMEDKEAVNSNNKTTEGDDSDAAAAAAVMMEKQEETATKDDDDQLVTKYQSYPTEETNLPGSNPSAVSYGP